MRLESVLFTNSNLPNRYERMARVLALTAAENSPATPLNINRVYDKDEDVVSCARPGCRLSYINNGRKAKHHWRLIMEAREGDLLGMLDCDTMVLGDLSEVAKMPFDIAYTVRPPGDIWRLNTGVYFVRISDATRGFVGLWYAKVLEMLGNEMLHKEWSRGKKYGGTHQAALGCVLEAHGEYVKTVELPCETWNLTASIVERAESPKVVHVMGQFREFCFGRVPAKLPMAKALAEVWKEYDRRCLAAA